MITDQEIIQRLALFMGWTSDISNHGVPSWKFLINDNDYQWIDKRFWNPLSDWNHWRQVEEKVMEDEELWEKYWNMLWADNGFNNVLAGMKADLPTRCKALISVLNSSK